MPNENDKDIESEKNNNKYGMKSENDEEGESKNETKKEDLLSLFLSLSLFASRWLVWERFWCERTVRARAKWRNSIFHIDWLEVLVFSFFSFRAIRMKITSPHIDDPCTNIWPNQIRSALIRSRQWRKCIVSKSQCPMKMKTRRWTDQFLWHTQKY